MNSELENTIIVRGFRLNVTCENMLFDLVFIAVEDNRVASSLQRHILLRNRNLLSSGQHFTFDPVLKGHLRGSCFGRFVLSGSSGRRLNASLSGPMWAREIWFIEVSSTECCFEIPSRQLIKVERCLTRAYTSGLRDHSLGVDQIISNLVSNK